MQSACDEASILLKEKNLEVSSMISKKKKKKKKEIWDVKYMSNIFTQKEKKKKKKLGFTCSSAYLDMVLIQKQQSS